MLELANNQALGSLEKETKQKINHFFLGTRLTCFLVRAFVWASHYHPNACEMSSLYDLYAASLKWLCWPLATNWHLTKSDYDLIPTDACLPLWVAASVVNGYDERRLILVMKALKTGEGSSRASFWVFVGQVCFRALARRLKFTRRTYDQSNIRNGAGQDLV